MLENTTFTIYLALTYASPLVAFGPTCYVLWHNLWNSWQLQRQARQIAYSRCRLRQAFAYLNGLLRKAQEHSHEPWPDKLPCPECGAPAVRVRAEQRFGGERSHALVHDHPDGRAQTLLFRPPQQGVSPASQIQGVHRPQPRVRPSSIQPLHL